MASAARVTLPGTMHLLRTRGLVSCHRESLSTWSSIIAVSASLLSFNSTRPAFAEAGTSPRQPEAVACPSRKAEAFFEAFTRDMAVQEAFVDFPLPYEYGVGGTAKYINVKSKEELPFIEKLHGRLAEHRGVSGAPDDLYFEYQEIGPKYFRVGVGRDAPEHYSDYYIVYSFKFKQGCWRLFTVGDTEDQRSR
jgi:hypothetical protein